MRWYWMCFTVNSEGKICIPLTGFTNPIVKENGRVIYRNNKFVPGVPGITAGTREEGFITFNAGSGDYSFRIGEPTV